MKRGGWLKRTPLARTDSLPKQRKPLTAVSKKRQRENRVRRRVVDEVTGGVRPVCFVRGCSNLADDCHELLSRGRGGSITEKGNLAFVCRPHHTYLTTHPTWAEANGYALKSPARKGRNVAES